LAAVAARAAALVHTWRAGAVCVTLGHRGALLSYGDGAPYVVPARPLDAGDPCGAGDRFAATAALALGAGLTPAEAVQAAVEAATGFVAAGGAAGLATQPTQRPPGPAVLETVAEVRQRGGRVVATGGCFDLLHAGHVQLLTEARRLGDCLVVCLNSDASVRRLKGPDRPVASQQDRRRVLEALRCVDGVVVFAEDTPVRVLERLRPDVWVKGGDYALQELPETPVVQSWGGQVVLLPYVAGRSSSGLLAQLTP
jgi:rfaE bifunctional protein nucleotidyltransferase chain/domain